MAERAVRLAFENWEARFVVRGVDYGDVVRLSHSIESWGEWLPRWCEVAEEHVQLARSWEAAGHARSAGEAWNRAALCFHFGCFLTTHDEAAYLATSTRAVDARRRSLAWLDPSAERLEFELPPSRMVAILRRPAAVSRPPLVILVPGLDSTKEEFQTWEEVFLARGLATLSLDGPGQGEGGYGGAAMRADYEAAVGGTLNSLEGRDDLDLARVGLIGVSLGGYYVARAAAYEPRVRAVVSLGGPFDVAECWEGLPPMTREKARFHLGGGDPAAFTLRDAVRRIRQPLLVVFGRRDRLFPPEQAERLAAEAPRGELVMYEAGNHACTNVFARHTPMEADWLRTQLG
jgi:2,6-dihydroxypseudooxynicotine hydrolase